MRCSFPEIRNLKSRKGTLGALHKAFHLITHMSIYYIEKQQQKATLLFIHISFLLCLGSFGPSVCLSSRKRLGSELSLLKRTEAMKAWDETSSYFIQK